MFKERAAEHYHDAVEGGVRFLFSLGPYEFQDTIDDQSMRHFIVEAEEGEGDGRAYEVDRDTMYEFLARFLAGEFEMREYDLERSPAHDALLDVLEIATARARAGEDDFDWEEFDVAETEILEDERSDPADESREE